MCSVYLVRCTCQFCEVAYAGAKSKQRWTVTAIRYWICSEMSSQCIIKFLRQFLAADASESVRWVAVQRVTWANRILLSLAISLMCCSPVHWARRAYLVIGNELIPLDAEDSPLTAHVECLQFRPLCCSQGPCLNSVQEDGNVARRVYAYFSGKTQIALTPDATAALHSCGGQTDPSHLFREWAHRRSQRGEGPSPPQRMRKKYQS